MIPASSSTRDGTPALHRYVRALGFMTVLLIWWGAATTTKQAGMAFADWPLSFGSVNPPGWLRHMVPFLEHSHRLLATVVGLMTLMLFAFTYIRGGRKTSPVFTAARCLFAFTYIRGGRKTAEFVLLFFWLGFTFAIFIKAGAERQDADRKASLLLLGSLAGVVPLLWLAWSWWKRGWSLPARLSALALLAVTAQAILGGLRVTEISDTFAVIHGCLAQGFFCLVILIGLVTSGGWENRRDLVATSLARPLRLWSITLVGAIFLQLILGALMRHHHRAGLADTGIFLTAGRWFPGFHSVSADGDPMILLLMFAHKYWALVVFGLGGGLALWLWTRRQVPVRLLRHSLVIAGLLCLQIALGVSVLLTGSPEHKRFWVTNFHVINGLALLAMAFVFAVRSWRVNADDRLLAATAADGSGALPRRVP